MIKELRDSCSKGEFEPLSARFFRFFSIYLTALFAKLGLSPNFVSLLSLAGTVIGGVLLMLGSYHFMVIGAAVLVFSLILVTQMENWLAIPVKLRLTGVILKSWAAIFFMGWYFWACPLEPIGLWEISICSGLACLPCFLNTCIVSLKLVKAHC